MNSQNSLILLTILMAFAMANAHIGGMQMSSQDVEQVYCGRTLARALALFCVDVNPESKRSDEGSMYNDILSPYYKDQEKENQVGWPWISHHKARAMGGPSRGKRFVVNECCDKPCSINELLSYC